MKKVLKNIIMISQR